MFQVLKFQVWFDYRTISQLSLGRWSQRITKWVQHTTSRNTYAQEIITSRYENQNFVKLLYWCKWLLLIKGSGSFLATIYHAQCTEIAQCTVPAVHLLIKSLFQPAVVTVCKSSIIHKFIFVFCSHMWSGTPRQYHTLLQVFPSRVQRVPYLLLQAWSKTLP